LALANSIEDRVGWSVSAKFQFRSVHGGDLGRRRLVLLLAHLFGLFYLRRLICLTLVVHSLSLSLWSLCRSGRVANRWVSHCDGGMGLWAAVREVALLLSAKRDLDVRGECWHNRLFLRICPLTEEPSTLPLLRGRFCSRAPMPRRGCSAPSTIPTARRTSPGSSCTVAWSRGRSRACRCTSPSPPRR